MTTKLTKRRVKMIKRLSDNYSLSASELHARWVKVGKREKLRQQDSTEWNTKWSETFRNIVTKIELQDLKKTGKI